MGLETAVVVADLSEAGAIARGGDDLSRWPCLEAEDFDSFVLAALWEVLAEGVSGKPLRGDDLVVHAEDEAVVIHLPDDLRDRLAALSDDEMRPVAARWAAHQQLRSDGTDVEVVEPFLPRLSACARTAAAAGKSLLLRMG